jgi:hypothetical protein
MKVKIIKSGENGAALRVADTDPAAPQAIIIQGELREDLTDSMCQNLIDLGYAELADGAETPEETGEETSGVDVDAVRNAIDVIIEENKDDGDSTKVGLAAYAKASLGIDIDMRKSVKKIYNAILKAAEKAG